MAVKTEYERERNKLINQAEAVANAKVAKLEGKPYRMEMGTDGVPFRWSFFTEFFHEEMRKLTSINNVLGAE